MKNCQITLDVTNMGYTYLLQILDMVCEFTEEEDGTNEAAADTLRAWIEENAREFLADARAAKDFPAIDFFEGLTEAVDWADTTGTEVPWAEATEQGAIEAASGEKPSEEKPSDEPAAPIMAIDAYDPASAAVQAYLSDFDNAAEYQVLIDAARDVSRNPGNLVMAGAFFGAATMLAAHLDAIGAGHGASRTDLKRAIYDLCDVAW